MDAPEKGETLCWTAHPFLRARGRGVAILAFILILALALGAWTKTPFWGVFAVFILGLSLEGFYLPTTFELREQGVVVKKFFSRSESSWARFRRVYEDRRGLTLSPYRRKNMLEPYRSVRLLFDGGDPEAIRRWVRGVLPAEAAWC